MVVLDTYLRTLQDKVFALLPMREELDAGIDNHIADYITRLNIGFFSVFDCYPELRGSPELVEVQGTVAFLGDHLALEFRQWRSAILRATRLIGEVIEHRESGGDALEF